MKKYCGSFLLPVNKKWRIENKEEMEKETTNEEKIRKRKREERREEKPTEGWNLANQRGRR